MWKRIFAWAIFCTLFSLSGYAFLFLMLPECERFTSYDISNEVVALGATTKLYDNEAISELIVSRCELQNALNRNESIEKIWVEQIGYEIDLREVRSMLYLPYLDKKVGSLEEIEWWLNTVRVANLTPEYVDVEVGPLQCTYDSGLDARFPPFCDFEINAETSNSSIIVPGGLEFARRRLEQYLGEGNLIRAVRYCDEEITPMEIPKALTCPIKEITVLGISPEGPGGATFDEYGLISYK